VQVSNFLLFYYSHLRQEEEEEKEEIWQFSMLISARRMYLKVSAVIMNEEYVKGLKEAVVATVKVFVYILPERLRRT
jgi:hypothetical protein